MTEPRDVGANAGHPADPDEDGVEIEGLDLTVPVSARRLTPGESAQAKAKRKQEHEARIAKQQAERKERSERAKIQSATRERFFAARRAARDVVLKPLVLTPDGDIDTDQSGEPDVWSFRAYAREVMKDNLAFEYGKKKAEETEAEAGEGEIAPGVKPVATEAKVGSRKHRHDHRPRPRIAEVQANADHATARLELERLFNERFVADRARVLAIRDATLTEMPEYGAKKLVVENTHVQDGHYKGRVVDRLPYFTDALEMERVERVMDTIDWFAARCAQAEETMKRLTVRRTMEDELEDRLGKLDQDEDYLGLLAELDADIVFFDTLSEVDVSGSDGFQGKVKGIIKRQVGRAKKLREKINNTQEELQGIATENEAGHDKIEQGKQRVSEFLGKLSGLFLKTAQEKTRGMSPDQERDYWDSIYDRIMDAAPPFQRGQDPMLRVVTMNEELNIFHQPGGKGNPVRLFRAAPEATIKVDFEHIANVDELLAVAEEEAKSLGALRKRLGFTKALLGPGTDKRRTATELRRLMRGVPNEEKLEMARLLNEALEQRQAQAVKALDEADAEFKAQRNGRDPKVWEKGKKSKDNELRTKLRAKVYELLGIGTLDKPDFRPLAELMTLPEDADAAAARHEAEAQAAAIEREERGQGTFFDELPKQYPAFLDRLRKEFKNPKAEVDEQITVAEIIKLRTRRERLVVGLRPEQQQAFETAFKQALDLVRPTDGLTGSEQVVAEVNFLRTYKQLLFRAEQLRVLLGDKWAQAINVIIELPDNKFSVEQSMLDAAVGDLSDGVGSNDFVDAFGVTAGQAQNVILNTINDDARLSLGAFGLKPNELAEVVLLSVPGEPHTVKKFNPNTRIAQLVEAVKNGTTGSWADRLVNNKLATMKDGQLIYDVVAIRKLMNKAKDVERVAATGAK